MLGLEANGRIRRIGVPALASTGSVEVVGGVKLHAGLAGENREHTPRMGIAHACSHPYFTGFVIEHEIVVIPFGDLELRVVVVDSRADRRRFSKIERRAGHWFQLA